MLASDIKKRWPDRRALEISVSARWPARPVVLVKPIYILKIWFFGFFKKSIKV